VDALQASANRAGAPYRRWSAAGAGVALVVALVLFALRMMGQADASAAIAPDDPVVTQAPTVEQSPMPPEAAPPPEAVGPVQRFTVALASYRDVTAANAPVEALTRANPGHLFISAPIVAGGTVYHRLLAGRAPDADAASRLSGVLSQAISESSASWIVRHPAGIRDVTLPATGSGDRAQRRATHLGPASLRAPRRDERRLRGVPHLRRRLTGRNGGAPPEWPTRRAGARRRSSGRAPRRCPAVRCGQGVLRARA